MTALRSRLADGIRPTMLCVSQRYQTTKRDDVDQLIEEIIALASEYGRYAYWRNAACRLTR